MGWKAQIMKVLIILAKYYSYKKHCSTSSNTKNSQKNVTINCKKGHHWLWIVTCTTAPWWWRQGSIPAAVAGDTNVHIGDVSSYNNHFIFMFST